MAVAIVARQLVSLSENSKFALILACFAMCAGCNSANLPDIGTVSGIVTLDGKPVKDAVVQFQPSGGRPSRSKTNVEGYYELGYVGDVYGAVLGSHKVTISTQWMDEDRATHKIVSHPETLPAKYNSNSKLTSTVEAGHNDINFELTSE